MENDLDTFCVICQSAFARKSPENASVKQFLSKFFALFKISEPYSISEGLLNDSFNSENLPVANKQLTCHVCQDLVNDASEILVKLDALQKNYDSKLQLLRRRIRSGRPLIQNAQSDYNTDAVQETGNVSKLRKAIVQLFSSCEVKLGRRILPVLVKPTGLRQKRIRRKNTAKTSFAEGAVDLVEVNSAMNGSGMWNPGKDDKAIAKAANVVKNEFPRKDCDEVFKTKKYMRLHQMNQHKRQVPRKRSQRMRVKISASKKAEVDVFTCFTCLQTFKKSDFVDSDSKITIPCGILGCKKVYKIFAMFQDHHLRTCRKDASSIHTCEFCGRVCYNDYTLRAHIMSHHTKKFPYYCDQCGAGQPTPSVLARHMLCHTEERLFKCDLCPASFKRKPMLTYHIRKHTMNLPFVCEICGKRFHMQQKLVQHKGIHSTSKDFPCPVCSKMFVSKHYVYNHVRNVHGRKQQRTEVVFNSTETEHVN